MNRVEFSETTLKCNPNFDKCGECGHVFKAGEDAWITDALDFIWCDDCYFSHPDSDENYEKP